MHEIEQLPADHLLDRAIAALAAADAPVLQHLVELAALAAPPGDPAYYRTRHATFAALLEATARNLRLLRRSAEHRSTLYAGPRRG